MILWRWARPMAFAVVFLTGWDVWAQEELDSIQRPPVKKVLPMVPLDSHSVITAVAAPSLGDSLIRRRMAELNQHSPIGMVYNPHVKNYIDLYARRRSSLISRVMGRSGYYFPLFEEILLKHQLPLELKYLAVIESGLNPKAQSPVGAKGLWQFMHSTALMKGLEINTYVDERADPIKSTEAACRYLKELYGIFGDWHLVLAAYNSGPGNVAKAIKRSGGVTDYWTLRPYLPRETAGYVPAFLAVTYVMENAKEYGISTSPSPFLYADVDTVDIRQPLSFAMLSASLGVSEEIIAELNPSYRYRQVPGPRTNGHPYHVVLPKEATALFIATEDSIYKRPALSIAVTTGSALPQTKISTATHTVRRGDTLSAIARKYGVTARSIQKTNGLRGERIDAGQRLKIQR